MQVSAVDQAVELLGQSVTDMRAAHRVVMYSTPSDAKAIAAAIHATDARADEVSRMARCAGISSLWRAAGGAAHCLLSADWRYDSCALLPLPQAAPGGAAGVPAARAAVSVLPR